VDLLIEALIPSGENTERERTKAIMEEAYTMMKAIGVESLRRAT